MYKRVLLKLSGEALSGEEGFGIDQNVVDNICDSIKTIHESGVQIGIVVGGGNFWRGKYGPNMEKYNADFMGMLATTMNSLALQDALEKRGIDTRVQTSIDMKQIAEPVVLRKALNHLNNGKVVIFAGGTGHPYFSTDTAAALRAVEIGADIILVAKTTDGVYSDDPKINKDAVKFDKISYQEILDKNLKVMDSTAIAFCKDNNMPLIVFAMKDSENIIKAANGESIGTYVN